MPISAPESAKVLTSTEQSSVTKELKASASSKDSSSSGIASLVSNWFGGDDEKDQVKPAQVSEMIAGNDRVNGTIDKLPTPEQAQKQVASQDNRQMVFSPSITIPPSSGNPEADQRLIDSLIERMKAELMPMMGGGELAVRLDASLSDRSNT